MPENKVDQMYEKILKSLRPNDDQVFDYLRENAARVEQGTEPVNPKRWFNVPNLWLMPKILQQAYEVFQDKTGSGGETKGGETEGGETEGGKTLDGGEVNTGPDALGTFSKNPPKEESEPKQQVAEEDSKREKE